MNTLASEELPDSSSAGSASSIESSKDSGERPTVMHGVSGHIDGIVDDAITGWIVNYDQPTSLEPLVIYCHDNGARMQFRPHWYRDDVCEQIGTSGIFGIAIPIDLLPSEWKSVSIATRSGQLLGNGQLTLPDRKPAGYRDGNSNIFLHIQKTAGTSLRAAIETYGTPADRCLVYWDPPGVSPDQFHSLPLYQRRRFDIIAGHMPFGMDRFLGKPCRYYTFLREPMARLRSHYRHYRTVQATSPDSWTSEVPLETIVNDGLSEEFDNYQVRVLAGVTKHQAPLGAISESELEIAVYNVENHFGFVGFVENMESDAATLFKKLNIPSQPIAHMNVSDRSYDLGSDQIDWEQVRHRHRYEAKLYSLIRSHKVRPGGGPRMTDHAAF